jgi:hypothetical protein
MFTTGLGIGLNAWHIMSGPGTFHSSHFDASGLRTVIRVLEGFKGWLWGRRKGSNGHFVSFPGKGEDWHWSLFKNYDVYFVVLGPGDTA